MNKRMRSLLRWLRWTVLTIILLPIVSMILIKITGAMKMRKADDVILGELHALPLISRIDTAFIGDRQITYLHTSKTERKKKTAIVFVHGSPGSLDASLEYMADDSLLEKADLIAYDRPGFGHSDFGESLSSLRGQARILNGLLDHLNYDAYWLIGHSYGGAVIVQAGIDRQGHISGLGIIAGSVIYEMEPAGAWRKLLNLPFIRPLMPVALRVSNDELISLRRDLRMIDDDWDKIRVPVSLIHGSKDVLVPFKNLQMAKEKLVHADSVRTLIFDEENHFILWTQKESIVNEILELIAHQ